jgi:hypothetical protein
MKIRLSFFIIAIILPFSNSHSQSGSEIEQDFLHMRNYLVAIGTVVTDSIKVGNSKIGIKKFVAVGSGLRTYTKYDSLIISNVVTAGHVIKYFRDNNLSSIFIRPSWADTLKITEYYGAEIPLINPDKSPNTYLYPDENIDLGCILMLPFYYGDVYLRKVTKEHDRCFPYDDMTTPYIGNEVWICGYPEHVEIETENRFMYSISTFKPGHIAWKPSENMTNKELYHITLVESNATYGNSGGPVFSLQKDIELVGIMVGGYDEINNVYLNNKPYLDPITKQPLMAKSRAGVSIIERAEYVRKLVLFVESEISKYK